MESIFGISMNAILAVAAAIMATCLIATSLIAWRNPVIFRMAVRNLPRRKAQTILVMIGLMLSTLIIAASLTTGDTLSHSLTGSARSTFGEVDATVSFTGERGGSGSISTNAPTVPATLADDLARIASDDIDAVMPVLTVAVPASSDRSGLSEPRAILTGIDAERLDGFGGLRTPDGALIDPAALGPGKAVLSESLAERLDVEAGDQITVMLNNQPVPVTVSAVASGSILTGYEAQPLQAGPVAFGSGSLLGAAVSLDWLQDVAGLDGQARFIAVSGGEGVSADALEASLDEALASVDDGAALGVDTVRQDAVDRAEQFGNIFTTFFLLFGLFSIAAGVLLIVLVFTMLAAERRSEMGMARAVGMSRSQLVKSFVVEGVAYDLGAALIGAVAGVLVSFTIIVWLRSLLGDAFGSITPYATWRSLAVAYSLGVSVTFVTIVIASARASRLNIVSAIRDLPEDDGARRTERPRWRWWSAPRNTGPLATVAMLPVAAIWNVALLPVKAALWLVRLLTYSIGWGPVLAAIGAAFMALGVAVENFFAFSLGVSLFALGAALLARRVVPSRLAFTVAAAAMLAYWLMPPSVMERILPELGDGGPEMFFLSGVFMVAYTTLIVMWNADVLVRVVSLLGGAFSRWAPAVKTAIAYPVAARGRTGMTIAMFAMVIFSLVTVRTINANYIGLLLTDEAAAGWDISVATSPANPIDDLRSALREGAGSESLDSLDAVGRLSVAGDETARVRAAGETEWSTLTVSGMDAEYMDEAEIPLGARASGYSDDAAVWAAIRAGEPVAVVDLSVFDAGFGASDRFMAPNGVTMEDGALSDFDVEVSAITGNDAEPLRVIGVIDSKVSTLSGLYVSQEVFEQVFERPDATRFYARMNETAESDASELALQIESALRANGAQAESIQDQIEEQQAFSRGFFSMLQGFMGLGLFVGIAALGVISFRSVVERRQQIGMLRALGYQRGMVAASFLIESLFTATLGVASGSILATVLSYNLIMGGGIDETVEFTSFVIPWGTIVFFNVVAVVAALVMTWVPARRAASVPIAEALRFE